MESLPFDVTNLSAFAALLALVFLVFRYFVKQQERNTAFSEQITTRAMERAEDAGREMQQIVRDNTEALREITKALMEGNNETVKGLQELKDAQAEHERKAELRHRELTK